MLRILALLLAAAACVTGQTRPLTLLHTNDLHARLLPFEGGRGGFAQLAALIRQEREGCGSCLLLNAGDLVQGSPVSTLYRGLPVYEIANLFGFDVSTIGNHDFDYGWQRLREFMKTARYPMVSANVSDVRGGLLAKKPYVVLKAGGLRVAVIGVETESLGSLTTPKLLGPWRVTPIAEAVRRYAEEARRKADLVVLLAHITPAEEEKLLAGAPEIPVIISGHTHHGIPAAMEREGRVLVRAKAYAEELGRLDLQVDAKTKRVTSWKWRAIPVDGRAGKPASDVARKVEHWEGEVSKVVDVPIAESSRDFTKAQVRAMLEAAMRERVGADFAFMNFGGVRDVFPRGRILARHVWNVMPFDNKVVVGRFKGSRLPEAATRGAAVDPDREYTLATSDYSAANQSSPTELRATGLVFSTDGPLLRDVLLEWVKAKKVLDLVETVAFEERFAGALAAGWSWVREKPGSWRVDGGRLVLPTLSGTLWAKENTAANLLLRAAPKGDFATEATVYAETAELSEQAGLIWHLSDGDYIKLVKEQKEQAYVIFAREEKEAAKTMGRLAIPGGPVMLRLSLQGGAVRAQARMGDSEPWRDVGACPALPAGDLRIGMFTHSPGQTSRTAGFAGFRILRQ